MAEYYISKIDLETINRILSKGKDVLIKRDRELIKICEQSIKVAKKKRVE